MSKLYIIANSHIDPVWIWSLSSGRNSWLNTLHSTVKIMEEYPDIKFTCSAAACFRYIEECDPALFRKIARLVENSRFEIVGGWEVQSDSIISRADTLLRQGESGKAYFKQRFGIDVDIAYNVDAFGHSAGLPKILNATGFKYYVFGRPDSGPILFDWKSQDDSQVTALRVIESYNFAGTITKNDFLSRIDRIAERGLEHQTVFFGVGDHGGGLTRHHLEFLDEAAKKHELVFSTLKEYFASVSDMPRPTVTGELGPTLRGCYSACHQIKKNIARTVKKLHCAESLGVDSATLDPAWNITLFNHFHDILPGTSIRQAYEEDIFPSLGMAEHTASTEIDKQLSRRAAAADTSFMTEGGVQIYNPNPYPVTGIVSITGFTDPNNTGSDFNELSAEDGSTYPLQILEPPTTFGPAIDSWGTLTASVPLAPGEEKFLAYRRSTDAREFTGFADSVKLLSQLRLAIYRDDTHTWGFTMQTIDQLIGIMELKSTEELTDGPVVSILRCNYEFNGNFARLDICRYRNIPDLEIKLRLDWHLTHCAVKLELTPDKPFDRLFRGSAGGCVCEQLITDNKTCWQDGHRVVFAPGNGEQSFIDYCAVGDGENYAGFLVDDLHSCDAYFGKLRLTVLRPVLYADHAILCNTDSGWMDLGVSQFSIWYTCGTGEAEKTAILARTRLNNIESREVTGHPAGDEFSCSMPPLPDLPDNIFQHACRKTADGMWKFTWENQTGCTCQVSWKNGDSITIKPWELLTLDCQESQD